MNRRGFLGSILALATPPAFVRYGSLMVPKATAYSGIILIDQRRPSINFGLLTAEQKRIWSEALWREITHPPSSFSKLFMA